MYKRKLGRQKLTYPIQKLGQQNFLNLVLIQIFNQYINSCWSNFLLYLGLEGVLIHGIGYERKLLPRCLRKGTIWCEPKRVIWSKEFSLKSHTQSLSIPHLICELIYLHGDSHSIALSYFLICFNWLCWANAIDHVPWLRGFTLGERSRLQGIISYNSNSQTVTKDVRKLASVGKLESGL